MRCIFLKEFLKNFSWYFMKRDALLRIIKFNLAVALCIRLTIKKASVSLFVLEFPCSVHKYYSKYFQFHFPLFRGPIWVNNPVFSPA